MLLGSKWRITIVFTVLATAVCIVLGIGAHKLFNSRLTEALDVELGALAEELSEFVNLSTETSDLQTWRKTRARGALRTVAGIGLYDAQGMPVETYGDFALSGIAPDKSEVIQHGQRLRVLSRKLQYDGKLVGWLQITVPTTSRDRAISEFSHLMRLALPAVCISFLITGYFFAGWTISPIEQAYARLKRFLADAGHELKTPLTIAQTHSEALEQELLDQSITSNRIEIIRTSLKRLQRLVEDLVLLTQTEAPQFLHPTNDVAVDQIVQAVAEDFKEKCSAKRIDLRCDVASHVRARCDPEFVRRAVSNLIENAWRYTEPGGNILLSATSFPKQVKITVEDSGIGIPAEALPHLFERFYRVESSRSRKDGGSGLGLAIVKGIVEAHGGKVSVQSSPGSGSKFTVTLPTG